MTLLDLHGSRFACEQWRDSPQSTKRGYLYSIHRFAAYLNREPTVTDLNQAGLAAFATWLEREQYAPATVRDTLGCVRALWQHGVVLGHLNAMPPRWFAKRKKPWTKKRPPWAKMLFEPAPDVIAAPGESNLLASVVDRYRIERDVAPCTVKFLRYVVNNFERFLDRPAALVDLNDDTVNCWLAALHATNLSRETIKAYRRGLIILWRFSYEANLVEHLPRRVRKVKVPQRIPVCWSIDELRRLFATAAETKGKFRTSQISKARFWAAFIQTATYTGLRLGDLLKLEFDQINADGWLTVVQHKTGQVVRCFLPAEARAAIEAIRPPKRKLIFGATACQKVLQDGFQLIVKKARLTGSIKRLRATGATLCEAAHSGSAMAFLGHRTHGLAYKHYVDPARIQDNKPLPPLIGFSDR